MAEEKEKIHNAHDSILKRELQNINIARDVLSQVVPDTIRGDIDWDTLALDNNSYIDPELRARESDIVFSAKLGNGEPLNILIFMELESQAKQDLIIRFQRYLALAIEKRYRAKQPKEKLPLIVPLCLYTGVRKFPYSRDLMDYFEAPELASRLLHAPITLIDVAGMGQQDLAGFRAAKLLLMLPIMARANNLLGAIQDALSKGDIEEFAGSYGGEELKSVIIYILNFVKSGEQAKVIEMLNRQMPHYTQEVKSAADVLRLEGYQEGRQEGRDEGISIGVVKGIEQGFEKGIRQRNVEIAEMLLQDGGFELGQS